MASGKSKVKTPTPLPVEAEEDRNRIAAAYEEEHKQSQAKGLTGRIGLDVADTIFGSVIEWTDELHKVIDEKLSKKESEHVIKKLNDFMNKAAQAVRSFPSSASASSRTTNIFSGDNAPPYSVRSIL